MTIIDDGGQRFVHASDIQFLHAETIDYIINFHPDIVLASCPPLYLLTDDQALKSEAWNNILKLSEHVSLLIVDHHLLRSSEGVSWLNLLAKRTKNSNCCAADYMKVNRQLLEAMRTEFYQTIPVPDHWHEAFARGTADPAAFLDQARQQYDWFCD